MGTAFWLSIVMAVAGCTGLLLAGRGHWQGWALGLAVQPVWAVFAIVTKGYGLLITCVMYGAVYGKNLWQWRKKKRADTALERLISAGLITPNDARRRSRGRD